MSNYKWHIFQIKEAQACSSRTTVFALTVTTVVVSLVQISEISSANTLFHWSTLEILTISNFATTCQLTVY